MEITKYISQLRMSYSQSSKVVLLAEITANFLVSFTQQPLYRDFKATFAEV